MVCSDNVSMLQYCLGAIAFTVNVTACKSVVTQESFSLSINTWDYRPQMLSESCVHISWLLHTIFPDEWELKRFQTAKNSRTFILVPFDRTRDFLIVFQSVVTKP